MKLYLIIIATALILVAGCSSPAKIGDAEPAQPDMEDTADVGLEFELGLDELSMEESELELEITEDDITVEELEEIDF